MSNTRRIRRAVEISEKEVCSIMTHRKDVRAISGNKTIDDAFNFVSKAYFNHLPIYEDIDKEKFIGVIHVKQILQAKKQKKEQELLTDTVKRLRKECSVLTLPEFLPIVKALPLFQEKQKKFAIVIDEFGGLAGVISLSDIARYILTPDLFSENNEDFANGPTLQYSSEYVKARPSAPKGFMYFDVKAETPLSEIEEMMSVQIYPRPESHTIAGYLIEYTGGFFMSVGTSKKNKIKHPVLGEFSITKKTTAKIISLQWKMSKELDQSKDNKGIE